MNSYIVHTAIKCTDGKVHRLSYDLTEQTEGSVYEFARVFKEIEKRFPDVQFWIQQYPDNFKYEDYTDEDGLIHTENIAYKMIHGELNEDGTPKTIPSLEIQK